MIMFESLLYELVFLIICLCGFLYHYFTKNNDYWKNKGVMYEKPIPFFGNIKDTILLKLHISDELERLYKKFPNEDYVGMFLSRNPSLLVRNPELIKQILVKDFNHFFDRHVRPPNGEDEPLQQHLVNLDGQKWKAVRAKLSPTFTSGKLKQMFNLLTECGEEFQNYLSTLADRKEDIEVCEICAQYTTDVVGSCAFGIKTNSIQDPNSTFREMGRKVFDSNRIRSFKRSLRTNFPGLFKFLNLRLDPKEVEDFFKSLVRDVVKHREETNEVRNDFMQLLIQLKNRGYIDNVDERNIDLVMDENFMAAQSFVFFAAGYETSSTTMSFCLYELALHPDIQEKAQKEVNMILEKHSGRVTYEGILEMEYLEKVVAETMRKQVPVGLFSRVCTADYTIPGTSVVIEKGLLVLIPVQALHYDPQFYPEPDKFDPERFSEENKNSRHQFSYLPFGEGPRICIGLRFAKLQTMVGLVLLLSKFQVKPCARTAIPLALDPTSIIRSTKDGIWLKLDRRPIISPL